MTENNRSGSIFSQKLDRVAFLAYFLGAVVPLAALGVVLQRFALPTLDDNVQAYALIGLVFSIGGLSFGSFLTLRRATRQSLVRMDRDNQRLESLLQVSGALAAAEHGADAAAAAARCAVSLTGATAAYALLPGSAGALPVLSASSGDGAHKLFESHGRAVAELADVAMSGRSPALRGGSPRAEAPTAGISAMAAVPLCGDSKKMQGALAVVHTDARAGFEPSQVGALSTLAALTSVALQSTDLRDAQRNFFIHVTDMLLTGLDGHPGSHRGHSNRVAELSNRIGRELGLDERSLHDLHFAALLHDIGLIKLDPNIQKNPRACRKHPVLGARMLARIRLWQHLAPVVHAHHEWWDGSGYPDGTKGEAIPLLSRIIGLCEAVDAMTSPSTYKAVMSLEEAVAEVGQGAGSQFDPAVSRAFLALAERGAIRVETG